MPRSIRMPRAQQGSNPIDAINALAKALEQQLTSGNVDSVYTVANGVTTRTLDVSTATASDVAKVVGTLLNDLQRGSIGT